MRCISKMRDVLDTDFLNIKIAASARSKCFLTTRILGTYQIIICTLSTPLEWGSDEKDKEIIHLLCGSVLIFPECLCGTSIKPKFLYHIE